MWFPHSANNNMKAIELTYESLLADVAELSGFSEIRGSWWTLQWCIHDAPKLEKHVLRCTETGENLDLQLVPTQLQRLALGSMKDPILMRYLRQLLLFCYKANVTYDNKTKQSSFEQFARTNQEVEKYGNSLAKESPYLLNLVRAHCQSVLSRIRPWACSPSHGPGASTTSKDRWEKVYSRIEYCFPYSDWYALYYNQDHLSELDCADRTDELIEARLTAVPKDSRGPRLICVHPAESIWLQQGLRRELERAISLQRYGRTDQGGQRSCVPCSTGEDSSDDDGRAGCGWSLDSGPAYGWLYFPSKTGGYFLRDAGSGSVKLHGRGLDIQDNTNGARPFTNDAQLPEGRGGPKVDGVQRVEVRSKRWRFQNRKRNGGPYPVGPWPHGHVHFRDQTVNGRIALLSSRSRKYATLDLKEASDRLSEPLVQILFGRNYKWFGCCRAQRYRILGEGSNADTVGDIACYAPMGNATTFPVQSLVFWAICVSSLQRQCYHQPGAAFVFGDDIIVPTECAKGVIYDLESFGLIVNKEKSFWRGAFRESCGVDAFNGFNVTPIRWKTTLDAEHLEGLQSLSDLAMRLRIAGYESAAATCYAILRQRLFRYYRRNLYYTNNRDHGGLAEYTPSALRAWGDASWHHNKRDKTCFHMWVTPVLRLKYVCHKAPVTGWNQVLESVCSLERTGRSSIPDRSATRRIKLDRGWIQVR